MKQFHKEALHILKNDINIYQNFLITNKTTINQLIVLIDELKEVHLGIENDNKMKAEIKYIKLSESVSNIQKVLNQIDQISNVINIETEKINKRKDILVEQIYKSYPDKKKVDINNEIEIFMSNNIV